MIVRFSFSVHTGRDSTTDFCGILPNVMLLLSLALTLPFLTAPQQDTQFSCGAERQNPSFHKQVRRVSIDAMRGNRHSRGHALRG